MRTITGRGAVAALMLLVFSSAAFAAGDGKAANGSRYERKHRIMESVIRDLGLSNQQIASIEEQRSRVLQEKRVLKKQIRAKKEELRKALSETRVDEARIHRLVDEISGLKAEKLRKWVRSLLAIRETLTTEQFIEFQTKMRREFQDKMK